MNVELICVGTELLLGNILNTNAKYISEKCAELGLSMFYQTVVGDNPDKLKDCILTALGRSDCIITSGGLGPTNDDLTKEIITEALGLKLVEDKETVDRLYYFFNKISRPGHSMTPNNLKQAMVPEGCTVLTNKNGTAPGILIEKDCKTVIMLPGPPRELVPLFEEYCIPYFLKKSDETIYSVMVKLVGIGESEAAARIDDILNNSTNPTVAPYAKTAEVHLRITAKAHDEEQAKAMIEPVFEKIKDVLGPYIYSTEEDETLEDAIIHLLNEKGLTITTAESCTGGLLAGRLINVSGASDVYKEGFVTYSNEAKAKRLGVTQATLDTYGAVSEECAAEMARGAAMAAGTDIGVSTTGIAGPLGGTPEKPVGLVYIGIYYNGETKVIKTNVPRGRQEIRERTVVRALDLIRTTVLQY